jgi:hypothetical protein
MRLEAEIKAKEAAENIRQQYERLTCEANDARREAEIKQEQERLRFEELMEATKFENDEAMRQAGAALRLAQEETQIALENAEKKAEQAAREAKAEAEARAEVSKL